MTTTPTLPNLQGAYLTGVLLGLAKRADAPLSARLRILETLISAHEQFPSLNSADVLAEVYPLRDELADRLAELEHELERERRDRFEYLDGDHREPETERLPEHDYPG